MEHIRMVHASKRRGFIFKRATNNILLSWLACNRPECNSDVLCFLKYQSCFLSCNLFKSVLNCWYCREQLGMYLVEGKFRTGLTEANFK
jgi:hypothetical protein